MLVGRELKARCCSSILSVTLESKRPRIRSSRSIRRSMIGWRAGSGVWRPAPRLCHPYFVRKPNPTGDRGAWSAQCDRARWVTVVCTLGAETQDSLSPPSSPSSCRHSMTSTAFGTEAFLRLLCRKLIFCFLPTLLVSQSADLSSGPYLATGYTKQSFLSQSGFDR